MLEFATRLGSPQLKVVLDKFHVSGGRRICLAFPSSLRRYARGQEAEHASFGPASEGNSSCLAMKECNRHFEPERSRFWSWLLDPRRKFAETLVGMADGRAARHLFSLAVTDDMTSGPQGVFTSLKHARVADCDMPTCYINTSSQAGSSNDKSLQSVHAPRDFNSVRWRSNLCVVLDLRRITIADCVLLALPPPVEPCIEDLQVYVLLTISTQRRQISFGRTSAADTTDGQFELPSDSLSSRPLYMIKHTGASHGLRLQD